MPNKANTKPKSSMARMLGDVKIPKVLYLEPSDDQNAPWDCYEKEDASDGVFVIYVPVRVVSVTTKNVRKETVI